MSTEQSPLVKKRRGLTARGWEALTGYAFILPCLVGLVLFLIVPMLLTMLLSFTEWDFAKGLSGISFNGIENYIRMFSDARVGKSLVNNLVFLINVPISTILAVFLASALNRFVFFKKALRTMYYLPFISSMVAIAIVWRTVFSPEFGPVNEMLRNVFGVANPPGWFLSNAWVMPTLILLQVWYDLGNSTIILIAGMQSIPRELYEAAEVDGASAWQRMRRITIPMLTPNIFFLVVIGIMNSFKTFDLIKVLTNGGPGQSSNVLVYAVYHYGFKMYEVSYASAISMLVFAIILILTLVQFKLQDKWVNY